MLERILQLLSERSKFYETGVQTSIYYREASQWLNLLTKIDFVRQREKRPEPVKHEYTDVVITRRLLSVEECTIVIQRLVHENTLETGHRLGPLEVQARLSIGGKSRWAHSEWSP